MGTTTINHTEDTRTAERAPRVSLASRIGSIFHPYSSASSEDTAGQEWRRAWI